MASSPLFTSSVYELPPDEIEEQAMEETAGKAITKWAFKNLLPQLLGTHIGEDGEMIEAMGDDNGIETRAGRRRQNYNRFGTDESGRWSWS
ncbi:hypothetical protein LINPERHAP2_LOCUS15942 [Linum perenne]